VIGTTHNSDLTADEAQVDTKIAYDALAIQTCDTTFDPPADIGGLTLVPGVYCFRSAAHITGTLTLDAQGNTSPKI
jgi:hypothetical protein